MSDQSENGTEQKPNDICPECGCVGRYLGESTHGGPSVGHGAPSVTEHWECMAENCDEEWSA